MPTIIAYKARWERLEKVVAGDGVVPAPEEPYVTDTASGTEVLIDSEVGGPLQSIEVSGPTSSSPNLTGFFDNPLPTSGTSNDYWSAINPACFSLLGDGWAHFSFDNTGGSSSASRSFSIKASSLNLDTSKQYTLLVELRNVSTNVVEAKSRVGWRIEGAATSSWDGSSVYQEFSTDGTYWLTNAVKSAANLNQTFYIWPGAWLECDIRVSLYEGIYRGPYVPADGMALVQRGEAVTPMFKHCIVDMNVSAKPNAYWRLVTGPNSTSTTGEGSHSSYEQNKDSVAWPDDVSTENGWIHMTQDARNATSVRNYNNIWVGWDCLGVEEGQTYTWLIEVKHLTLEGDGALTVTPSIGHDTMDRLSACDAEECTFAADGYVSQVVTAKSDFSTLDGTRDTRGYASIPAGTKADYWLRLSLYKGEYQGEYKPHRSISTPIRTNGATLSSGDSIAIDAGGTSTLTSGGASTALPKVTVPTVMPRDTVSVTPGHPVIELEYIKE